MQLNLPIFDQLSSAKNILIAGMGGGFDVFCGLPIFFELKERGMNVHLANLSFSNIVMLGSTKVDYLSATLAGVNANYDGQRQVYFPEHFLSQWFKEVRGEDQIIWCFHKSTILDLLSDYRILVDHLNIDAILLIDGGVDSLARGDEAESGTLIEDSMSLLVVDQLDNVPLRLVACLGFGAEQDMTYAHFLENIADLAAAEVFLGNCALIKQMPIYQQYEDAVLYVQHRQTPSIINSSVISAVQGKYGDYHLTSRTEGSRLYISPLMSLYWFFEAQGVAERNLLIQYLKQVEGGMALDTMGVAIMFMRHAAHTIKQRRQKAIPL